MSNMAFLYSVDMLNLQGDIVFLSDTGSEANEIIVVAASLTPHLILMKLV